MSATDLKLNDLLEFSKMCAPEYNTSELSDRVLVLDVMQDGWETARILNGASTTGRYGEAASEALSQKQSLGTSEEPASELVEEETLNKIKTLESETGGDPGNQSENERKDPQKAACKQDSKPSQVDRPKAPSSKESTEDVAATTQTPASSHTNEPVRQHKIYVHSFWLSVQSQYFRSLFYSSGMKENQDHEVHVKVSESEENTHLILLEAMYRNDVLNDKTVDELLAVLELANKYDLKFVFKKCKYVLQENATTFEISTQIMHVIKVKHNMSDVEDLATTLQLVLAKEFSPLDENWQSEKFTNLSEPSLKYLLSSDDLIVQSENTVFHALMYWMEQNEIDPAGLEEKNDLLAVVRFKLITIDYLYNVIKNHPIASKMPKFAELCFSGMTYHAIPSGQKTMLKDQPVIRKKPEGNIIQYTFVINEQDYESIQQNPPTELQSDEFWACGYKMSICLLRPNVYSNVYPYLIVHNTKEESLIPLKFAFFGQTSSKCYSWLAGTFSLDSSCVQYSYMHIDSVELTENGTRLLYLVVEPM